MRKLKSRKSTLILCATALVCGLGTAAFFWRGAISVTNSVNGRELPIYRVGSDKPGVALTFDAAWGNEDLEAILAVLNRHKVQATFFMTGEWVKKYPEDVKRIKEAGHDLGNHSESHKNMSQLSPSAMKGELMLAHEKVEKLTGVKMDLFRAPYGDYNNELIKTAKECGYYTIQWDVDSLDWKNYGADSIVKTVVDNKALKNGSIILLHNGAKYTKDALDAVITGLEQKGYAIVPVSKLIHRKDYHMEADGQQVKN